MKLFLIPRLKKPKTNKIVINELAKLHDKVRHSTKKINVKNRLDKAILKGRNNFIETKSLRFKYCSPELFSKMNYSSPISSEKINKEASLMYSLGLMILDLATFQDLTHCYTKYNV